MKRMSAAIRNTLPSSAFLDPKNRKLPVKTIVGGTVYTDKSGKKKVRGGRLVSSPSHMKSAQGRAMQVKGLSKKRKTKLSNRATRLLKKSRKNVRKN